MTLSVLLAGGGTGGHVFPLLAIADALRQQANDCRLRFVGTRRGLEASVIPTRGYRIEFLDIRPIRGLSMSGMLHGIGRALAVMPESQQLLEKERPDVVLSVGGYAAGPVTLAAWLLGIPTALLEPNSAMGLTNLCLAALVNRAYTAFDDVEVHFSKWRTLRAGVPLRAGFCAQALAKHRAGLRILILGGSQGAAALNQILPQVVTQLAGSVQVLHQTGRTHADTVRNAYRDSDPGQFRVVPFIDDMPAAIAWSDVVVSRAGASALSEICAIGRASILIPYPFAAGAHQLTNARALARIGAAICVQSHNADEQTLLACLQSFITDRDRLVHMGERAASWSRPDAASVIARDLITLANCRRLPGAPSPPEVMK